jgi:hypothetical protein
MQSTASQEVEKFFNYISLLVAPPMLKHLIQTAVGIQFDEVLSKKFGPHSLDRCAPRGGVGTSSTSIATLKHS